MILKGSQRGFGQELAAHLLNTRENDHVTLHELRGFSADDLYEAFREADAVSRGTRCRQYLFSLSLNPPALASVLVEDFEKAISRIERKLGFEGQPRAVLFHEKEGRRHAHVVWSRIDAETMTAVHLPHFKRKLTDISRELYREHGWQMPRGLVNREARDPLNFTLAEWQQAKRRKADPKALKAMFAECWESSDSRKAFGQALAVRGFALARGDSRGFVAVDLKGEVYSLSRWTGQNTKALESRLGSPADLPDAQKARHELASTLSPKLSEFVEQARDRFATEREKLDTRRQTLVTRQRAERQALDEKQTARTVLESQTRAMRLPRGLKALWLRMTGSYKSLLKQNADEAEAAMKRDRTERQAQIDQHLLERQALQKDIQRLRQAEAVQLRRLHREFRRDQNDPVAPDTLLPESTKALRSQWQRTMKR
jgi:hypothetical protein